MKTKLLHVRRVHVRALSQLEFGIRFPSLLILVVHLALCLLPCQSPPLPGKAHPILQCGNAWLIHENGSANFGSLGAYEHDVPRLQLQEPYR